MPSKPIEISSWLLRVFTSDSVALGAIALTSIFKWSSYVSRTCSSFPTIPEGSRLTGVMVKELLSVDFGLDGFLVDLESRYRVDELLAGGCFAPFQFSEAALHAYELPLNLQTLPVEEDEEERGEVDEVDYLAE